jgi:PTH1 family peptidyl-tRNA hydrolase
VPLPGRSRSGAPVDWLIVGLGNPGAQYERTPHNIGFAIARELARRWGLGRPRSRWRGELSEGRVLGDDGLPVSPPVRVAVLLPQTYMNDAGRSVGPARGELGVELDHVLVLHDEIDLPFGEIRARVGGGLAGHNGLKSIRQALGSPGFARLRVGVGRPPTTDPERVAAYVLGRFQQPAEEVALVVGQAADAAERVLREGPSTAPVQARDGS